MVRLRHLLHGGALLVVIILLLAVPVAEAVDEDASDETITSGTVYNLNRPFRGFLRIDGKFDATTLDLSTAVEAIIVNLLKEGGVELADVPLTLTPRLHSQRVTVFETVPGAEPFGRLTVRTCIPELETCPNPSGLDVNKFGFRLEVQFVTIAKPAGCPGVLPHTVELDTFFQIVDGDNAVNVKLLDVDWQCFNKNRSLRHPPI